MLPIRFQPGDPAPWFVCAASNNPRFSFDTIAGRYVVMSFFGTTRAPAAATLLREVCGPLRPFFDDEKVCFFGITVDPDDRNSPSVYQLTPGIRHFWDFDCAVSRLYGALGPTGRYEGFTLVLDPALRVMSRLALADAEEHNRLLREALSALPPPSDHAGTELSAPVLIAPRVLEPDFCAELIAFYQAQGGQESGFMRQQDGQTVGIIDHNFKRRRDVYVEDAGRREQIRNRIQARLLPLIERAFQYRVSHLERYLVACYDGAEQGFFRPHRDNTTAGTAHRRFACTINLNAGDYAGGGLRFPEFGPRVYVAPTGGAVVFSCSLLHEALPVTEGRRYALLPFFYDDRAAELRARNEHYLSGTTLDMRPPPPVAEMPA
ncbi:MAG: 2OG-Fe(II) oxygenase [Alphaproteobacteria bacterium]